MNQTDFIEKVAKRISELGLTAPAIFLLEVNKPLAFIGSQFLLIAQPSLDIFLPHHFTRDMADFLADPAQLDQLISRLETGVQNPASGEVNS
jgi:hypothetical protein